MALHDTTLKPGRFFACSQPERPYERGATYFDLRCRACRIAAQAAVLAGHDHKGRCLDRVTGERRYELISESLAESFQRYEGGTP